MAEKIRLDVYMTETGMSDSRERAKALIKDAKVYIGNKCCDKPGMMINPDEVKPEIRGEVLKYVSRGGLKLEKALVDFPISLLGKTALDIGASTGGFSDCMLQNGAIKVFAVDVGTNQLSPKLKEDKRVVNMEGTNIRHLTTDMIASDIDFISIDVSFISLKLVLPIVYSLLADNGEAVALIKPQFEAGRGKIGKKGVVKDKKVHQEVCLNVTGYALSCGFCVAGLSYSPIKGPEGNIEYLLYLKKSKRETLITEDQIKKIIELSHKKL